jgi:hypothetical protein
MTPSDMVPICDLCGDLPSPSTRSVKLMRARGYTEMFDEIHPGVFVLMHNVGPGSVLKNDVDVYVDLGISLEDFETAFAKIRLKYAVPLADHFFWYMENA